MNRRTRIIISVAGIFIVLLALLGLTYAYFLTRINGNTNDKSISVSTAKLELTYSDNSSEILGNGNIIQPSDKEIGIKTFTVTNNGEDTNYSVIIENMSITDSSNNETTFLSNDFRYTLTCTDKSGNTCDNKIEEQTIFPLNDGILLSNNIKKGDIHTYTLTLWYLETEEDQSNDMGKSISARINIMDPSKDNPYKLQKETLAYNIINNAMLKRHGTEFRVTPLTVPAQEELLENEKELSMAPDDYGMSYYYRGSVKDNYLELNNMCFRIVRIEGDGSIKLTLAKEGLCSSIDETDTTSALLKDEEQNFIGVAYGLDENGLFNYVGYEEETFGGVPGLYKTLNNWYNTKLSNVQDKLKEEEWCLGGSTSKYSWDDDSLLDASTTETAYLFETGVRLNPMTADDVSKIKASYKCPSGSEKVTGYVGSLIADEEAYAGASSLYNNVTYYLNDNAADVYWLLSYFGDGGGIGYVFYHDSSLMYIDIFQYFIGVRPAVTLASGAELLSGDGTQNNPYKIVEN